MEPVQTVCQGQSKQRSIVFSYKKVVCKKKVHLSMLRSQVAIFIKREKLFFEIAPCDSELNGRLTTSFLNGVQKLASAAISPTKRKIRGAILVWLFLLLDAGQLFYNLLFIFHFIQIKSFRVCCRSCCITIFFRNNRWDTIFRQSAITNFQ